MALVLMTGVLSDRTPFSKGPVAWKVLRINMRKVDATKQIDQPIDLAAWSDSFKLLEARRVNSNYLRGGT